MPSEPVPPPIYSQDDPEETVGQLNGSSAVSHCGTQILIIPTTDAINFQKGYVGAEGERAAIEGELQIKGAEPGQWDKVTMSFRTIEKAYEREIELAASDLVLYSASKVAETDLPSSLRFAIPLTQDAPQCIHTPHSSLSHTLSATLHPSDAALQPLSKTLIVHTRRYTSHSHTLEVAPETHSLDDPTRIEVEVPRTTFKAGEPIPVYVKVPPPRRELVIDHGLRLRNIRAELIRVVKVQGDEGDHIDTDIDMISEAEETVDMDPSVEEGPSTAAVSTAVEKSSRESWSPKESDPPLFHGSSYKTIVSRSGAACRFHSSIPVRLRFVLHPSPSPSEQPGNLPDGEYAYLDGDTHCASITQTSLLHSVTFRVNIHASFVDMSNRTERFSTVSVPVMIIPPPAPLPEVEEWIDAAYQKKHDRPPARTVRLDDLDVSAPHYHEGEAGPSVPQGGAPPPFEERDAPPPFFSHAAASTSSRYAPPPFLSHAPEASTSSRLPTFLESEREIFVPTDNAHALGPPPQAQPIILGEGIRFGFSPSEQFDGHSQEMQRSSTPPPSLEMATQDTNLTNLADLHEPQRAMEALGIALDQQEEATTGGELPPPPPAMDDPSDPPPSIDSDFRSPDIHLRHSPPPHSSSPPPSHPTATYNPPAEQVNLLRSTSPAQPTGQTRPSPHGHAPPPYLVPGNEGDQEHVMRPPPYMDLMPPTSADR